jgi:hypothetical protein
MTDIEKLIKNLTCDIVCLIALWGLINHYDKSYYDYYVKLNFYNYNFKINNLSIYPKIITFSLTGYIISKYI